MSVAEQLQDGREDGRGKAAAPRDALMEAEAVIEAQLAQTPARRPKLRPLLALAPYMARYRGRAFLAVHRADGRGGHHAGGAGRGAPRGRLRLEPRRHRHDQQLFQRDGGDGGGARRRQCGALLPRHDHRRAHRRRYQARRACAPDLAVTGLFRFLPQRGTDLAADVRCRPDQIRRWRLGFRRLAQHHAVHRRHHHDGDHQPQAVRLRAAGDPGDRAAAGGVRTLGEAADAPRTGPARFGSRLCRRAHRRHPHRAGLYRRGAGECALWRRDRAGL